MVRSPRAQAPAALSPNATVFASGLNNSRGLAFGPDGNLVIFYEHAGTASMKAPGRCAHSIVVHNGKITSIDWVTYYAGMK